MAQINVYDGFFLLNPDAYSRNPDEVSGQLSKIVESLGGVVTVSRLWDERKLAYSIDNHRRGAYAVYVKSFDGVVSTLRAMGGTLSAKAVEVVRRMKHNKNNANRQTNADMANLRRTANAAGSQMILVDKVYRLPEYRSLSPALREFCTLRTQNPELSLAQLGELCNPPASKSAMYHRVLRLQALVAEREDQAKT